jgi:hypothetical protein
MVISVLKNYHTLLPTACKGIGPGVIGLSQNPPWKSPNFLTQFPDLDNKFEESYNATGCIMERNWIKM